MPVTITTAELAAANRIGDSAEETAEVERLRSYAVAELERYLGTAYGTAPDAILNEAARAIVGYIFDAPLASRGAAYANAVRNSGAGRMVLGYRIHRAGSTGEAVAAAQEAVGTPANPVTDVVVDSGTLTVSYANGDTESYPIGGAVDFTTVDFRVAWRTGDVLFEASDFTAAGDNTLPTIQDASERGWYAVWVPADVPTPAQILIGTTALVVQGLPDPVDLEIDGTAGRYWARTDTPRGLLARFYSEAPVQIIWAGDRYIQSPGNGAGGGVDQQARTAAQAAQAAADAAQAKADANADKLMPATPSEAEGGTATAIRGWTAALIRAAVNAVLPADERLVPAGGTTGDILLRQAGGASWTGFRAAVLSVLPASQGSNIGPLTTITFTSHATAQRYSATGFTPPSDWQLVAVEDRQAAQVFSGLVLLDLDYMRTTPAADRPANGDTYPDVDAGLGVYALSASGELLAATFAASVEHTLIYRRMA